MNERKHEKKIAQENLLAEHEAIKKAKIEKEKRLTELKQIKDATKVAEVKRLAEQDAIKKAEVEKEKHLAELKRMREPRKAAFHITLLRLFL